MGKHITKTQKQAIIAHLRELAAEGYCAHEAAKKAGISPTSVSRWAPKNGITFQSGKNGNNKSPLLSWRARVEARSEKQLRAHVARGGLRR